MGKWSSRQNTTNHSESSSSLGKWNLCVGLSKSASWNCCYSLRVTCRRGQKYGWVRQKIALIKMWFSWFFSLHVSFVLFHVQSFLWSDCYNKLHISTSFFADILTLYITFPVPAFHGTDVVLIMKALRILEGLGKVSVLAYSNYWLIWSNILKRQNHLSPQLDAVFQQLIQPQCIVVKGDTADEDGVKFLA